MITMCFVALSLAWPTGSGQMIVRKDLIESARPYGKELDKALLTMRSKDWVVVAVSPAEAVAAPCR